MIVSLLDYKAVIKGDGTDTLLTDCLQSAQSKIEDVVGYALEADDYVKSFSYAGSRIINLGVYNINSISSVKIDGVAVSNTSYSLDGYYLQVSPSVSLNVGSIIEVSFNAGWTSSTLPASIKQAIIFIAQALSKNSGGGGYASQQSFGNQGSVTFDTTRYYRFYDLVNGYRVFKL